ncbi:MAG: rane protein, partial [Flavisolibacter sp.]|nr:rane protein [Flavisolibacter sp.]
ESGDVQTFKGGTYNKASGDAVYKVKSLPPVMDKLTKLHKANSSQPLFFLNVFFSVSLLFFVISSFWMFLPKTTIFKKGLYFAVAGLVLTVVLLFL